MSGVIEFLGTGASTGVPLIGCQCNVCASNNLKNRRLRTSVRIFAKDKEFLIDATPDFRQQALTYGIDIPDALLLTHSHFDHIGGLEELRVYNVKYQRPIECYLSNATFLNLKKLFYYHFGGEGRDKNYTAEYTFHPFEHDSGTFDIDGINVQYFSYAQGNMPVTGFRIGALAYITDIKQYDTSIFSYLKNLDVLVISALRFSESKMQMTFDEALSFVKMAQPKKTYFTHLSHDIEFEKVSSTLAQEIMLAYDGLRVEFSLE